MPTDGVAIPRISFPAEMSWKFSRHPWYCRAIRGRLQKWHAGSGLNLCETHSPDPKSVILFGGNHRRPACRGILFGKYQVGLPDLLLPGLLRNGNPFARGNRRDRFGGPREVATSRPLTPARIRIFSRRRAGRVIAKIQRHFPEAFDLQQSGNVDKRGPLRAQRRDVRSDCGQEVLCATMTSVKPTSSGRLDVACVGPALGAHRVGQNAVSQIAHRDAIGLEATVAAGEPAPQTVLHAPLFVDRSNQRRLGCQNVARIAVEDRQRDSDLRVVRSPAKCWRREVALET